MTGDQRRRAVGLVAFLGVCFGVATYIFSVAGTHLIPGPEPYRVRAVVPTAVSLAPAADVSEAGVDVGRVGKVGEHGANTVLEIKLDAEHAPVYRDARVLIRAKSIAGENYVQIDRGHPRAGALPSGGILSIEHADEATQIDEFFSVFDDARREDLQRILAGLGGGLRDGGGDLNRTLEAASAVAKEGAPAIDVLAAERDSVARLVDSFGRVTRALGDRRTGLQTLTRQAKAAAEAVAVRDEQLRDTLAALPPFLRQARTTSTRLGGFSRSATPVMGDLRRATEQLVPAVKELKPAAIGGQAVVRELDGLATAAIPAVKQLAPFSANAEKFVPPLAAFLRELNPFFAHLAPYAREIGTFFANDAASFNTTDKTGHVARVLLPISRSDLPGVLTAEQEKNLQALSGQFDTRGTNAYPAPGQAGDARPFGGDYPRLTPEPDYNDRRAR